MRFLPIFLLFALLSVSFTYSVRGASVHVSVEVSDSDRQSAVDHLVPRSARRSEFFGSWHPPVYTEDHPFPVASHSENSEFSLNSAQDEVEEGVVTAESKWDIHFPSGYYSLTSANSASTIKELEAALEPLKKFFDQNTKSSIEIKIIASESQVTNYDKEGVNAAKLANKQVNIEQFKLSAGKLSEFRANSLKQYLQSYFQKLYDACNIEDQPTFIDSPPLIGSKSWNPKKDNARDPDYLKDQYVRFIITAKAKAPQWKCLDKLRISVIYDRSPKAKCPSRHSCNRARFFVLLNGQKLQTRSVLGELVDYADLNNEGGVNDATWMAIKKNLHPINSPIFQKSKATLGNFYLSPNCKECMGGNRNSTFIIDTNTAKALSEASSTSDKLSLDFGYRVPYMDVNDDTYPIYLKQMNDEIAKLEEKVLKITSKPQKQVLRSRIEAAKKDRDAFVANPQEKRIDNSLSQPHTDVPQIMIERFINGQYETIFNGCPNAASGHLMTLDRCGAPLSAATSRCPAKK
jgi:hypothetical protein